MVVNCHLPLVAAARDSRKTDCSHTQRDRCRKELAFSLSFASLCVPDVHGVNGSQRRHGAGRAHAPRRRLWRWSRAHCLSRLPMRGALLCRVKALASAASASSASRARGFSESADWTGIAPAVDAFSGEGKTALLRAVLRPRPDVGMVRILLDMGAHPSQEAIQGRCRPALQLRLRSRTGRIFHQCSLCSSRARNSLGKICLHARPSSAATSAD